MMNHVFNHSLIEKYSTQGPRYTSYPTAVQFSEKLKSKRFEELIAISNQTARDLSLYAHIPFCDSLCYYCACNKIITKNKDKASSYLDYLEKEIRMVADLLDAKRRVIQLHWGGGTPTFLNTEQQWRLMDLFQQYFDFADDKEGEFSIEIDPRTVTENSIANLRKMGFNRLSFGIQDFDYQVQAAVNRIQSEQEIVDAIKAGRQHGFHSISVDLIYGLPLQTAKSFSQTLDKIIDLSPDRLAVFNYAHLPHIFKVQKKITDSQLPDAKEKLNLLELSINRLIEAGYVFIGLDHFAKPDDSLVKHQENGSLYRNFQGYSTFSDCDLLGFGVSSISQVGNSYSQNMKENKAYYEALDNHHLPTARGVELSQDDIIRRKVITEIMCNMRLEWANIDALFAICSKNYFKQELQALKVLHKDGLLELSDKGFIVLPPGRLLVRNIAMIFDIYLPQASTRNFSKVI